MVTESVAPLPTQPSAQSTGTSLSRAGLYPAGRPGAGIAMPSRFGTEKVHAPPSLVSSTGTWYTPAQVPSSRAKQLRGPPSRPWNTSTSAAACSGVVRSSTSAARRDVADDPSPALQPRLTFSTLETSTPLTAPLSMSHAVAEQPTSDA